MHNVLVESKGNILYHYYLSYEHKIYVNQFYKCLHIWQILQVDDNNNDLHTEKVVDNNERGMVK